MTDTPQVEGDHDPRFGAVAEAFAENFNSRGERGAGVAVIVDGALVCDLWGGWSDVARTSAWQRDTLVNIFSVGKGLASACVVRLAGQGLLDPDAPVARTWPEFAAAGKSDVTVRQVLSHQAGLPSVRRRLPAASMLDHARMADALAEQEPWWSPGTAHGYHVNSFGFLVGEIVRRACGMTLGTLLRQELAGPLGADVHIGLGASDDARVSEFAWPGLPAPEAEPVGLDADRLMEYNAYHNPSGLSGAGVVNTRQWRAAEIPSTNAHATARGVARIYEALAAGGTVDGTEIVSSRALRDATTVHVDGDDRILHRRSRFGLGFQLTQPERPLGPNPDAFGHFGAGGSLGFCDPTAGVAFGYVMNDMGPRWQNPRNRALIDAVYASLS